MSNPTDVEWQYRIEVDDQPASTGAGYFEKRLNDLGQEGWELVGVSGRWHYLKRPIRPQFRLKPPVVHVWENGEPVAIP